MSYDTLRPALGHEPFQFMEIISDKCSLTAGVAPCTATETGNEKCFNTFATCNDTPNYTKTTEALRFCQRRSNIPDAEGFFPAIIGDIRPTSATVTGGKGLGDRGVVTVKMADFPHHDRGIDPYVSERTYTAIDQGTFWGKWLKRNPYYETRTLKIYRGYLATPFSTSDYQVEEYDITTIDGPTNGVVTLTAKDILIRTYDDKSQYPAASTGTLIGDITATAATATLTPTGIGDDEYPASGLVSIGKEAKTFTRAGDVLTFTANGQWGTEDVAHSAGDVAQLCVVFDNVNAVDALDEIMTTGAGIPSSYIPYGSGSFNWDTEKDTWLASSSVYGVLLKPTAVKEIISEFSSLFLFDIWWNSVAQEIQIKALSPEPSGVTIDTLTEGYDIIADSIKVKRDPKQRFTEIRVWHDKLDYSDKDDAENFGKLSISVDPNRAGVNQYNSNSIKTLMSKWFVSDARASQLTGRLLARFSDTPEIITFKIHAKDEDKISLAGRIAINSWQFQDFTGANEIRNYQITKITEDQSNQGDIINVTALTSSFRGRYGFIAPTGVPDYSSATEEQKDSYAFIAPASGFFSDGEPAYKII